MIDLTQWLLKLQEGHLLVDEGEFSKYFSGDDKRQSFNYAKLCNMGKNKTK